jgi:hypothetical protein
MVCGPPPAAPLNYKEWLPIISVEWVPFLKDDKLSSCRPANLKQCMQYLCISILLLLLFGVQSLLLAQDEISVSRDKDKTVYTIESGDENRQEQAKEKDRAWDMLNNMPIIIDKRQGRPAQSKPPQPAPSK